MPALPSHFNNKPDGSYNKMKFIGDLHIHSRYSMATSKKLVPEHLEYWAKIKGINLVGTGDCIHPGWSDELHDKLTPLDNGLFALKEDFRLPESARLVNSGHTAFILSGEISSIYKKHGKVRKIHNIMFFPDFESLFKVQRRLDREGNIRSDGRPILGLDPKIILEMMLEASDRAFMVPAHIWTPWFSLFGSKSGFDTIEECFGDLSSHIFAVETGLSSDPPMNRLVSSLDNVRLISNSDAHSPEKLGREANLFDCDFSYDGVLNALKYDEGFAGTIEFFPEEGKYHLDGHRACGIRTHPKESLAMNGVCPVCGKPLTLGVLYRVYQLADRETPENQPGHPHRYATRLADIIAEVQNRKSCTARSVVAEYFRCIESIGSEFDILLEADIKDVEAVAGPVLAEAVNRLREGRLIVESGYDGEFGKIRFFGEDEISELTDAKLFSGDFPGNERSENRPGLYVGASEKPLVDMKNDDDPAGVRAPAGSYEALTPGNQASVKNNALTPEVFESITQDEAVAFNTGSSMVIAGPGSGKTRVLINKTAALISRPDTSPSEVIALTFSNKAASEISDRLEGVEGAGEVRVHTFHSLGLAFIRSNPGLFNKGSEPLIIEEDDIPDSALSAKSSRAARAALKKITAFKEGISPDMRPPKELGRYGEFLKKNNALDLPDLVYKVVELFKARPDILDEFCDGVRWLLVDEAQDINPRQFELIKLIVSTGKVNLFIIGDPDQSIYGFRGAIDPFSLMRDILPGIKIFELDKSYRCPDKILTLGASLPGITKRMKGTSRDSSVVFIETETDKSEADWIASRIEGLLGGVRSYSFYSGMSDTLSDSPAVSPEEIAVLCRSSFMFDALAAAFKNHGIPSRLIDNRSVFSREPYRGCLKLIKEAYTSLYSPEGPDLNDEIVKMIKREDPVVNVFRIMMIDAGASDEEIAEGESFIHGFGSDYPGFLRSTAMRSGADDIRLFSRSVSLMTIHAAKGLEFRHVFIPGCEEGIIPFTLFSGKNTDLAEEARLLYVGMTRAIESLYLSSARSRSFKKRRLKNEISRFADLFDRNIVSFEKRKPVSKNKDEGQMTLFE